MLLAADVGGTKTNLAIYQAREGVPALLAEQTLSSGQFESLAALVRAFLTSVGARARGQVDGWLDQAVFGVPGPVSKRRAQTTNLPWTIDARDLGQTLGIKSVTLLNDLQATAYGTRYLFQSALYTLQEGERDPTGPVAVIAPGTGLGQAFLTHDGGRYVAHSSEGGHADFAPADALQQELLRYLQGRFAHVSLEKVCSGRGLPNLYAFLKDSGYAPPTSQVEAALTAASDPTPVIVSAALERACPLCEQTLTLFLDILAAAAGNLALTVMATGGVFLGGGILPRVVSAIDTERVTQRFRHKGRFENFVVQVPVSVITEPKAALWGAACYGLTLAAGLEVAP